MDETAFEMFRTKTSSSPEECTDETSVTDLTQLVRNTIRGGNKKPTKKTNKIDHKKPCFSIQKHVTRGKEHHSLNVSFVRMTKHISNHSDLFEAENVKSRFENAATHPGDYRTKKLFLLHVATLNQHAKDYKNKQPFERMKLVENIVAIVNDEVEMFDVSSFATAIEIDKSTQNPPICHCTIANQKCSVKLKDVSYLKRNDCKLHDELQNAEGVLIPPHAMAKACSLTKRETLMTPTFGAATIRWLQ